MGLPKVKIQKILDLILGGYTVHNKEKKVELFIDYSKGFGLVDQEVLIYKLERQVLDA